MCIRDRLRAEGKKKELRSGKLVPEKVQEPTTIEELLEVPAVKKSREGR